MNDNLLIDLGQIYYNVIAILESEGQTERVGSIAYNIYLEIKEQIKEQEQS